MDDISREERKSPKYTSKSKIENRSRKFDPNDSLERASQQSDSDKSDVYTLITRVHDYYDRLNQHDQEEFFNSQTYIDVDKYDAVNRDMNLTKNEVKTSPIVINMGRNKPAVDYPRPMNLEMRFQKKHASPNKYRCASCTPKKRNTKIMKSNIEFRPNAKEPQDYHLDKVSKKYILETQLLLGRGNLKKAKETIDNLLTKDYQNSDVYFLSGEIDRQLGDIQSAEQKFLKTL